VGLKAELLAVAMEAVGGKELCFGNDNNQWRLTT
jgi:hypothetical protein